MTSKITFILKSMYVNLFLCDFIIIQKFCLLRKFNAFNIFVKPIVSIVVFALKKPLDFRIVLDL